MLAFNRIICCFKTGENFCVSFELILTGSQAAASFFPFGHTVVLSSYSWIYAHESLLGAWETIWDAGD